jgi:hypothetical protein
MSKAYASIKRGLQQAVRHRQGKRVADLRLHALPPARLKTAREQDAEILRRLVEIDAGTAKLDDCLSTSGMPRPVAQSTPPKPSVILFRGAPAKQPERQTRMILANLESIGRALEQGAVVVFEEARVRVRGLPIGEG